MNERQQTLRRAAIMVASLDRQLADVVLAQLTPGEATRVRQSAAGLGRIQPDEAADLLVQFRHARARLVSQRQAGVVLEGALANPAPGAHQTSGTTRQSPPPTRPFRFLSNADPRSLVPFLQRERPQTVAVVLSSLQPDQAATVLAALPARMQVDVVRRLSNLDVADEESLRVVAHEIETWLRRQQHSGERRAAGLTAVAGILAAADPADKSVLVDNLHALDYELAQRVAARDHRREPPARTAPEPAVPFAALEQLDHHHLQLVFDAAEPELVVLALAGAQGPWVNQVLDGLPRRQADPLRRALRGLGPIRLRDVEAAQKELVNLAQMLAGQGRIPFPSSQPAQAA